VIIEENILEFTNNFIMRIRILRSP